MSTASPLTIIAITVSATGQEKNLRAAQEKLVAETLEEPGCLRYELHQSIDDGRILIFVETWASEAEWLDHMQGNAIKRFQDSGAGNFIEDFKLHKMACVAG